MNKQKEAMNLIESYTRMMDARCAEISDDIEKFDTNTFLSEDYEYFDREKMERAVRTWDIIKNKLNPSRRNLYILNSACKDTKETFQYLSDMGYMITSVNSLSQTLCYIKEQIRIIYARTYGTVHIKRLCATRTKKEVNADMERKMRNKILNDDHKTKHHEYYMKNRERIIAHKREYDRLHRAELSAKRREYRARKKREMETSA